MSEVFISRFVEETPLSGLLANSRWMVSQKLPSFNGNALPDLFKEYSKVLDDYHKQSVSSDGSASSSTATEIKGKAIQNMPYDETFEVENSEKVERQKLMTNNYGLKMVRPLDSHTPEVYLT